MDQARRWIRMILDAYGSTASWDDVVRIAVIRLYDLAQVSRLKAEELGKPHLIHDTEHYEREAR